MKDKTIILVVPVIVTTLATVWVKDTSVGPILFNIVGVYVTACIVGLIVLMVQDLLLLTLYWTVWELATERRYYKQTSGTRVSVVKRAPQRFANIFHRNGFDVSMGPVWSHGRYPWGRRWTFDS